MGRITLSDYGRFKIPPPAGTKEKERPSYMDLYCRLAAIEDILGDEYGLDELRELVQAKREGRCVVLPCKVGDTVYYIATTKHGFRYVKSRPFGVDDFTWFNAHFGRTIFLTRDEAEKALKAREQDGNNK